MAVHGRLVNLELHSYRIALVANNVCASCDREVQCTLPEREQRSEEDQWVEGHESILYRLVSAPVAYPVRQHFRADTVRSRMNTLLATSMLLSVSRMPTLCYVSSTASPAAAPTKPRPVNVAVTE